MKNRVVQLISITVATMVLCVFAETQTPVVSHALERPGAMRMTNYAPLYLDPVEEENNNADAGSTTGDNAAGGTTVIDPNAAQGNTGASQESTDSNAATSQNTAGTESSNASQEQTAGSTSTANDSASQESTAGAGSATSGSGTGTSAGNAGSSSSAGAASTAVTVPATPNPYTANVNTKDMPATGVEDLRRGVVALILVLFGIVTILISIPTLKGKRRDER